MSLLEAIRFHNPTEDTFVGMYDGQPYDIPAKSTKYFAPHIAEHFAKHLVNKILNERFNGLCKQHDSSTKDLLKTCKECKMRSDKLGSFYEAPERKELLEQILVKDDAPVQPEPPSVE